MRAIRLHAGEQPSRQMLLIDLFVWELCNFDSPGNFRSPAVMILPHELRWPQARWAHGHYSKQLLLHR